MRLPLYPRPVDDEVLSSYVVRLAAANRLRPNQLTAALGLDAFWRFDPDVTAPTSTVEVLESATGQALAHTCLKAFLGSEGTPHAVPHLMLEMPRTRIVRGLPVCPLCLQEGRGVQRSWRLATTLICVEHACWLIDTCTQCHTLTRHVNSRGKHGPTPRCSVCREPLAITTVAPDGSVGSVLYVQTLVQQAFLEGAVIWGNMKFKRDAIISLIYGMIQLFIPQGIPNTDATRRFESSALRMRRTVAAQVGALMGDSLVSCLWELRHRGIHPMQLCRKACAVPVWLREVLEVALGRRSAVHPEQPAFRFTRWEWIQLADQVPSTLHLSPRRVVNTRVFIEDWLTGNLQGQQRHSRREQQAGLRILEPVGALTLVVEALLDSPSAQGVLLAPRTVGYLLETQNPHGEQIWRRMIERQIKASGQDSDA